MRENCQIPAGQGETAGLMQRVQAAGQIQCMQAAGHSSGEL